MKPIINHLIQLQELAIARAQHEASTAGARLGNLDASIKALEKQLPDDIRARFNRISKKDLLAIVPISNGVCSACGISMPVSMVQQVRMAEQLHACPACARLLYLPESTLRGEAKRQRRGETPKTGIERFSSPALMIPRLEATTIEEVIVELSGKLEEEGFVKDASKLADEAMKREAIVTTAVDHGIAFPHVRGVEGGGLALVLGCSKKGIKFGAPANRLTRLFFFMVIPTAASAFYLKLLSGLNQTFQDAEAREKLLEADTADKLWKTLFRLTKNKVS